jgi:hypothetical protein
MYRPKKPESLWRGQVKRRVYVCRECGAMVKTDEQILGIYPHFVSDSDIKTE